MCHIQTVSQHYGVKTEKGARWSCLNVYLPLNLFFKTTS